MPPEDVCKLFDLSRVLSGHVVRELPVAVGDHYLLQWSKGLAEVTSEISWGTVGRCGRRCTIHIAYSKGQKIQCLSFSSKKECKELLASLK
jgi:hypothetical protein